MFTHVSPRSPSDDRDLDRLPARHGHDLVPRDGLRFLRDEDGRVDFSAAHQQPRCIAGRIRRLVGDELQIGVAPGAVGLALTGDPQRCFILDGPPLRGGGDMESIAAAPRRDRRLPRRATLGVGLHRPACDRCELTLAAALWPGDPLQRRGNRHVRLRLARVVDGPDSHLGRLAAAVDVPIERRREQEIAIRADERALARDLASARIADAGVDPQRVVASAVIHGQLDLDRRFALIAQARRALANLIAGVVCSAGSPSPSSVHRRGE